jgi:hypothetical protein
MPAHHQAPYPTLSCTCSPQHPAPPPPHTHTHPGAAPLQELLACLKALLRVDRAWLPTQRGYSMYIRPFAYACSHNLGVHM